VRPRCVVWLCAGPLLLEVLLQASRRKCGCPGVRRACARLASLAVGGTALHGVEARWRLMASCLPHTASLPHVPTAPRPRPRPRLAPLRLRLPWPLRLQEGECRPRVCARQVLFVGVEDTCLPCDGAPGLATMPPITRCCCAWLYTPTNLAPPPPQHSTTATSEGPGRQHRHATPESCVRSALQLNPQMQARCGVFCGELPSLACRQIKHAYHVALRARQSAASHCFLCCWLCPAAECVVPQQVVL
jgi:hypothetical protein